jgi:hypothetical protein
MPFGSRTRVAAEQFRQHGRRFAMEDTDARQAVQESMDRRDQGESR